MLQNYLRKPVSSLCLKEISKIRMSSHNLKIEKGRYHNIERQSRLCVLCNLNDIEDEFHFILKCPLYYDLRER